ncbi:MAG: lipoyl synthase [Armatimonadetes bacterium]|nr:lipoyl synthase [Armatimonadota bacterium]MDW8122813.1 lipoyl synthase [Armatimonadota bacterium]
MTTFTRLPDWIRSKGPKRAAAAPLRKLLEDKEIVTVCQSARCPNIGECFAKGTATFMILGSRCTRRCGFCAVETGRGEPLDPYEPAKVAAMAKRLGLRHVVVTSVARDDLDDGGAVQFARTIQMIRRLCPESTVEVLVPDFKGRKECLDIVLSAKPDVFNHNVETVPRLHPLVRPQARYERSLFVLRTAREKESSLIVKSGLMLGLGECCDEVIAVLKDLRDVGCDVVTIGQYLRPTLRHLPVVRYVPPEEFEELKKIGLQMGFRFVFSGPFVRSSYLADEVFSETVGALPFAPGSSVPN